MRLHWHPFSLFPRRVRVALFEKGIGCDEVVVDLPGGALQTAAFRRLNPFGQVPVLEDDGVVLYESVAILEYLEERHPSPRLLPPGIRDRALARQWMLASGDYLTPPFKRWLARLFSPEEQRNRDDEARAAVDIAAHLDVLEHALDGRDYLAGDFSLADICYVPFVCEMSAIGLGELVESRPHLQSWIEKLNARASVRASASASL